MSEETLTPTQALLRTVPGRVARDINDWARGLQDTSPQKPVLPRLAESFEGIGDFVESRSDGAVAVFCLRTHDLLTSAVEQALGESFPATYSSQDQEVLADDRDDAYYLTDARFNDINDAVKPVQEDGQSTVSWDVPLRRGLNRVCTGRKKGDPVKTVVEIVIALVDQLADPNKTWPNIEIKEFVTSAKDGVRRIITTHQALKKPGANAATADPGDEFGQPPDELEPPPEAFGIHPASAPVAQQPSSAPKPEAPKPGKGSGLTLDDLQKQNADLRGQVSALQDEIARRLKDADADKQKAVTEVRNGLQQRLNDMEDARDRARNELASAQQELRDEQAIVKRLEGIEQKYAELLPLYDALKTAAVDAPDSGAHADEIASLQEQLAQATENLRTSEELLGSTTQSSIELQADFANLEEKLANAERTIHSRTTDLDEAHQKNDELRTRLDAAVSDLETLNHLAQSRGPETAEPTLPALPTPAPQSDPELLEKLEDCGDTIAKLGETIAWLAGRKRS